LDEQLVDRIYESALVPELWSNVLDDLTKMADGVGAVLIVRQGESQSWVSSSGAAARSAQMINEGWLDRSRLIPLGLANSHAGFLRDVDVLPADEWDSDPLYQHFWRPQGIKGMMGTVFRSPTGGLGMMALTRRAEREPPGANIVAKLDALRPHIIRSFVLSARLRPERARNATETLESIGIASCVLDQEGKILAANGQMLALKRHIQWRAQDQLSLANREAERLFRDALAGQGMVSSSFPVMGPDPLTDETLIAHVIPIRLSARDIFARSATLLILTPLMRPNVPPVELIRSLFDLTPAEARVAQSLAAGGSIKRIARENGVAPSTIRTQVRGVLAKTGLSRQGEVVALLTGIWSPRKLSPP
jgi:DNA-binding CsgD family transcriptional regulator